MNTYDYTVVTDRFEASGQIDSPDETSAEKLLRQQVATPRGQSLKGIELDKPQEPPTIKSIKLTLRPPSN